MGFSDMSGQCNLDRPAQHTPFPFVAQCRPIYARNHPRRSLPFAFRHQASAKGAPFHHAFGRYDLHDHDIRIDMAGMLRGAQNICVI